MSRAAERHYEVMLITHPDFSDSADEMLVPYRKLITKHGGTVTRYENLGRRPLAYLINKHRVGCYVLFNFTATDEGELVQELDHSLKTNDPIIRSLLNRTKTAASEPSFFALEEKKEEETDVKKTKAA